MRYEVPLMTKARALHSHLVAWRRYLHQHPELSFQEKNTAQFVKERLNQIEGMRVLSGKEATGVDTGVVGILENGPGPVVLLRADMDALPIQEENDIPYKSMYDGIMHACGHDAHTAILLGCAYLLSQQKDIRGTMKFLFQPAEEVTDRFGKSGASYVVDSGLLDDVAIAFALHMDPDMTVGHVKLHPKESMANVDTFQGKVKGTGGHGAYPHHGTDPIWMSSFVIQMIQGITSRNISPLSRAVVSIGEIKGGASTNVIPKEVFIQGTMRSYDQETRKQLENELRRALSIVETMGGTYELTVTKGEPALYTDEQAIFHLQQAIETLYPTFTIHEEPYGLGGEDFGYIAEKVPAAMMFIGAGFPDKETRGLHMPRFNIDDEVLPKAVAILSHATVSYLSHF